MSDSDKPAVITVARQTTQERPCEGEGADCPHWRQAEWEVQAMHADGSHYVYLCGDCINDYQYWMNAEGRLPLTFEEASAPQEEA